MPDKTLTLTAAGVDTTDATKWQKLNPETEIGSHAGAVGFAKIGVSAADGTAGNTGTLSFIRRNGAEVFELVQAVVTVKAVTRISAGSGNTRMMTVAFPNGTPILDMTGANRGESRQEDWYVGFQAAGDVPTGTTIASGVKVHCDWISNPP